MKKIIPFILLLLIIPVNVESLEIKVEPNEVKIGDDVRISCWHNGETSSPVFLAFIEKTPSSWEKTLNRLNDTYYWVDFTPPRTPPLLGTYKVLCSDGATNSSEVTFKVSSLDVTITDYPSEIYLGNELIIRAKVIEKSDIERIVTSGVDFKVFLNNKNIPIDLDGTFFYDDKWTITTEPLSTSFSPGNYELLLETTYKIIEVYNEENVEIKIPLEFELVKIDKTWVKPNDNVTFTFSALYQGESFEFKEEYLRIWIDSTDIDIKEISQSGAYTYVKISAPDMEPGTYDLDIRFDGMDFRKEIHETIDYVVPISGSVKDSSDQAVHVELYFSNNRTQKKVTTDNSGKYSDLIPLGTYKLELSFPNSKLILDDITVDEFDDPIKFDHPSVEVSIPGINVGAIFVYEIALTYSNVYLEMKYDDSKILDETQIGVYKCENWNFGMKLCNSEWIKIDTEVDIVRNSVELNTTELSAFAIGYKKSLHLDFNVDKDEYFLRDIIKVTGIVEDNDEKPVSDVTITASVPDTDVSASTKSDKSGVFSMEFQGPNKEGIFDLVLKAEKLPFSGTDSSKLIKILKSTYLSLVTPDGIKVRQGENISTNFDVVNIGQTDLSNLMLSLTGIPEEYYSLSKSKISKLEAGKDEKVSIFLTIPEDASKKSYTATLKVEYNGDFLEETFLLTILSKEINDTVGSGGFKFPSLSLPTANIVLEGITIDILIIVIVGIASFSIAIFLKIRKMPRLTRRVEIKSQIKPLMKPEKKFERENIKNLLLDIRREINRPPVDSSDEINKRLKVKRKK